MGVIAKQSGYAAIALGAGMVVGALNNMVVLPVRLMATRRFGGWYAS